MWGLRSLVVLGLLAVLGMTGAALAQHRARGGVSATAVSGVLPTWSPNGQSLAFASRTIAAAGSSWGVYVVGPDGRGRRLVVETGRDVPGALSWSPDGSRIAYDGLDSDGESTAVFTVSAGGGRPSRVTSGSSPSWGADNTLLVIDRPEVFPDRRIFVVNPDGSGRRELEPCPEADAGACTDGHPDWSPDGKRIAFDTAQGEASAVWTMDADGTNRRTLTPFFPPAGRPRWSPDGAKIVYERLGVETASGGDLSTMNANGTESRVLVKDGESPDWSPDGKTIAFVRGEALYLVEADGSNERPVADVVAVTRCVVPKLVGKTLATARTLLKNANCKTGKITRVRSRTVARGRVVSSKPKAGTSRAAGAAVALVVSRGR